MKFDPCSVFSTQAVEKATRKKFRLKRDSSPWPCDTGAMLYPLSYQATWIDGQLWVRNIPDDSERYEYEYMKIIYVNCGWNMSEIWSSQCALNSSSFTHVSSAVHIYDFHIFIFIYLSLSSGISRTHNWPQLTIQEHKSTFKYKGNYNRNK